MVNRKLNAYLDFTGSTAATSYRRLGIRAMKTRCPKQIVDKLNREIVAVLNSVSVRQRILDTGVKP
jgi:hypothetical protein